MGQRVRQRPREEGHGQPQPWDGYCLVYGRAAGCEGLLEGLKLILVMGNHPMVWGRPWPENGF